VKSNCRFVDRGNNRKYAHGAKGHAFVLCEPFGDVQGYQLGFVELHQAGDWITLHSAPILVGGS